MIRASFPAKENPRTRLIEAMQILQELQKIRGIDAEVNRALNALATAEAKLK